VNAALREVDANAHVPLCRFVTQPSCAADAKAIDSHFSEILSATWTSDVAPPSTLELR
jgi:hypothetical protein